MSVRDRAISLGYIFRFRSSSEFGRYRSMCVWRSTRPDGRKTRCHRACWLLEEKGSVCICVIACACVRACVKSCSPKRVLPVGRIGVSDVCAPTRVYTSLCASAARGGINYGAVKIDLQLAAIGENNTPHTHNYTRRHIRPAQPGEGVCPNFPQPYTHTHTHTPEGHVGFFTSAILIGADEVDEHWAVVRRRRKKSKEKRAERENIPPPALSGPWCN